MKARMLYPIRLVVLLGAVLSLFFSIAAQDCTCPQFQIVSGLEMVKAGDTVEFEVASAVDPSALLQKYEWTVSAGTIISGQGTRKIVVQTTDEMLFPKPVATPTPQAGELHGFFISAMSRRIPKLTVTATPAEICSCSPISGTVDIGRISREKNKPADATDLILSSVELTLPCEPGRMPGPDVIVSDSLIVDVAVDARDPENDILLYNYTVSGGKVVGTGMNVKWDLSTVAPGTYAITAGVDDGCGICGKTQTKSVTVSACEPSCSLIECPTVEISGPSDEILSAGENTFIANVSGGSQESVTYEWVVENGEILSGQNSPSIVVRFARELLNLPTSVTLRIGGVDPTSGCPIEQKQIYENGLLRRWQP